MKNRGFTLVELLAVIVVLAIIMIIAVPAVLDSMEAAQFNSFKIFGQNAIRKAMELHQEEELTGKKNWVTGHYYSGSDSADYDRINCYPLDVLKLETGGKYKGSVWYNEKDKTYRLYLTDGTYYTYFFPYKSNTKESASEPTRVGITSNDLNNATLIDAKKGTNNIDELMGIKIRLVSNYVSDTKTIDSSNKVDKATWFDYRSDNDPGIINLCGRRFSHK